MIEIREWCTGDREATNSVIRAAFGQEDEVSLIASLTKNNELILSLVAEADGHISFAQGRVHPRGGKGAGVALVRRVAGGSALEKSGKAEWACHRTNRL